MGRYIQMRKLKITFNAPVTLGFVFICFVVTLLGVLTGGGSIRLLFMTYHSSLTNPLTYLRFFTHVFGHAGWSHFIGNDSYLLLLGPMLEEKYGSKEMLEVIGVTALATGIVNYIFFWSSTLWSEWCRICIYRAGVLYRIPSRRNSVILYSGCDHLYRTAGI